MFVPRKVHDIGMELKTAVLQGTHFWHCAGVSPQFTSAAVAAVSGEAPELQEGAPRTGSEVCHRHLF